MDAGCGVCHTPALTSGNATIAALSGQVASLFSDLSVYHMGPGLADSITQGQAGPDEFRTAPLWGLGKRAFFRHDGRTSDLVVAIHQHRSGPSATTAASEANAVIDNFVMLAHNLSAARLFLLVWTGTSRTSPSASAARQR